MDSTPADEPEVVPGMAEAIEGRMRELRMTVGELVERSGVSGMGLMPLRRGHRRNYRDRVKFGVAEALEWPPDAVDRLLEGLPPVAEDQEDGASSRGDESEVTGIAAKAGRLSPEKRDRLIGYLDALLDEPEDD